VAGATTPFKPILEQFRELYPTTERLRLWRAPGRVNLIGEHTDYNLGLVLPMAVDLSCHVATAPSGDGWLRAHSEQFAQSVAWRVEDLSHAEPKNHWSDRVAGVAWELGRLGIPIEGQNLLIDSEVPLGAGFSSSAALGVALTLALGGMRDALETALIARAVETDFVGVPCGIMDQFVSAHGQAGAAVLLDCRTLAWRAVRLPDGAAVVAVNSMVKRDLAASAYRTRVEECRTAAQTLHVESLRDADPAHLGALDDAGRKRARHVVTENERVEAFAAAAEQGQLDEMGRLMTGSHLSLRDDYEVSSPELDFLVESALEVPGVLGARMMGGGFGGSTVNLVRPEAVECFRAAIGSAYQRSYQRTPQIHTCAACAGASEMAL
jgi:galactokinase